MILFYDVSSVAGPAAQKDMYLLPIKLLLIDRTTEIGNIEILIC